MNAIENLIHKITTTPGLTLANTSEFIKTEEDKLISDEQAQNLVSTLREHPNITELSLNSIKMSDSTITILSEFLKQNHSITTLSLNNCNLSDNNASQLASMLETNQTLQILHLTDNNITQNGKDQITTAWNTHNRLLKPSLTPQTTDQLYNGQNATQAWATKHNRQTSSSPTPTSCR